MAIESALDPNSRLLSLQEASDYSAEEVSVDIDNSDSVIVETDDGGMLIDFDPDLSLHQRS